MKEKLKSEFNIIIKEEEIYDFWEKENKKYKIEKE